MIFLTTTAIEIDEELLNRCIVLTVDEDREQTRAIHRLQRESQTLEGLLARRDADRVRTLHRNAQRLLQPILVANPYARELTFTDARTRTRRDHMKYLTLIRTIALLHQHQRERRTIVHNGETVEYIEVTRDDIALADRLAGEVLGRGSDPDLPPQTTRLLAAMRGLVRSECERLGVESSDVRFTRKEVRELVGWSETHVRNHLDRLVRLEYLAVHHGGFGQRFLYELVEPVEPITSHTSEADLAQTSHEPRTRARTTSHSTSRSRKASADAGSHDLAPQTAEIAHLEPAPKTKSYRLRRGNGRDHATGAV
jgi:hypothetical protein